MVVKFYLNVSAVTREELQLLLIPALATKIPSIRFNYVDVYLAYPHNVCGRNVHSTIMRRLTSSAPSGLPTHLPASTLGTFAPSLPPTNNPTRRPSKLPTSSPSKRPSYAPTATPSISLQPTHPTFAPSTVSVSHGVTEVTFDVTTGESIMNRQPALPLIIYLALLDIQNFNYQSVTDVIINALDKVIHNGKLGEQLAIEATSLAHQQPQYAALGSSYAAATLRNFTTYIRIDDAFHTATPSATPTTQPTTHAPSVSPTVESTTDPNAAAVASLAASGSSSYWALILLILVCFLVPLCIFCCRRKKAQRVEEPGEPAAHSEGARV